MATNLPATQKANTIRELFNQASVQKELKRAIPKHLTVDRLLRVAMTSIQQTPKLLDCTQRSLLRCIMVCAELGLEPSNILGQAYLVPFSNKGTLEAQLIPGYRGYIALARRSGEVQSVSAQVVYENDHFVIQYGLDDRLEHIPAEGDRGNVRGAYVVFRYKDGSYSFDYMPKSDIDAIKARSKAANSGPWVTDYGEMCKKTVIKRHAKLAPLSVEFQKASILEDLAHSGESQMPILDPDTIDANHHEVDPLQEKINGASQASPEAAGSTQTQEEYICPTCGFKAASERGLKKHMTQSHPEPERAEPPEEADEPEEEPEPIVDRNQEPPEREKPEWNKLLSCPRMDGNRIPASKCGGCPERDGCPAWDEPEGDEPF